MAWVHRRDQRRREHVPDAVRIVPMVALAGPTGLSRTQIAHALSLEPNALDDLIAALVSVGQLREFRVGDALYYRAV